MSTKHTPGPWRVAPANLYPSGINIDSVSVNKYVCLVAGNRDDEQGQADARLIAAAPELLEALQAHQTAQSMPVYGDHSDFVWPTSKMRVPGETAWGWICEKHGLGYQSGCICCADDFARHREAKDRNARYARDDALRAAGELGRAAIAKAQGGAV
jgi:hypothetical protein